MRYIELLLEDYKTAAKTYEKNGVSPEKVKNVLNQFRKIQPRISDLNLKNIDWWAKNRDFSQLEEYIINFEGIPTKSQIGKKTGRSYNITENNEWLIVIPLDKDASCFHGKTTDWCTTKPFRGYYENYFYDKKITLIYCIQKQSGNKWAIAAHKDMLNNTEYFDVNDEPLKKSQFEKQTGLNTDKILSIAFGKKPQDEVKTSRERYSAALDRIKFLMPEVTKTRTQNIEIEKLLWYTKNTKLLDQYMSAVGPANFNKNLEIFAVSSGIPSAITYIKNPSERVQIISAKKNGAITLDYLLDIYGEDNISDEVKLLCIKEEPKVIRNLKNQTEELKRAAIETGYVNMQFIQPPISDELKLLAIQKSPRSIKSIENPSEELQILAVKNNGTVLYDLLINPSKITPSKQVLIASVSNENAISAIDTMMYNGIKITDEIIINAMVNTYDAGQLIRILNNKGYNISTSAQIAAVNNDPGVIYNLYSIYDGNVSEAVQMVSAKESGSLFLSNTHRYIITTRKLIDVSNYAVEEAFKSTGSLTVMMMKYFNSLKKNMGKDKFTAFPTFMSFKNAIDSLIKEGFNSDVIYILSISFTYKKLYDRVVDYAEKAAKKDDNTMLQRLIKEYKEESDLDNLKFEPE
jgi:hypothetical protein